MYMRMLLQPLKKVFIYMHDSGIQLAVLGYRRGHGFKSHSSLKLFFEALIFQMHKLRV